MIWLFKKPADKEEKPKAETNSTCPYCSAKLDTFPKQKKQCTSCKKMIYIKKSPETDKKILVTENQAKKLDLEWKQIYFKRKWLRMLAQYNVSEENYETKKKALSEKFGQEASVHDVIWGIFNSLIIATHDLQKQKMIYYEMALFLNEENRDCFRLLEECAKLELMITKQHGFDKVEILWNHGCQECEKQNGKVFTVDEALKQMPLPCRNCTHIFEGRKKPFCRCIYLTAMDPLK